MRGPDCSAESDAARTAALPSRAPTRESLRQTFPVRSYTRRCRCTDFRNPGPLRWRVCIRQSLLRCALENGKSSQEKCKPRRWDAIPGKIDKALRPGRSRLPFGPDKRLEAFPRLLSGSPGSWSRVYTAVRSGQKYARAACSRAEPVRCAGCILLTGGGVEIPAVKREDKVEFPQQIQGGDVKSKFLVLGMAALAAAVIACAQDSGAKGAANKAAASKS